MRPVHASCTLFTRAVDASMHACMLQLHADRVETIDKLFVNIRIRVPSSAAAPIDDEISLNNFIADIDATTGIPIVLLVWVIAEY